ncbi:helix-turn-helix transcriptional regulator [Neisseriaceae bacterium B1]
MATPAQKIYRPKDVAAVCGVTVQTVYNWINPNSKSYRPDFPKPFAVNSKAATGFLQSEVDAFILKLAAQRKGETA